MNRFHEMTRCAARICLGLMVCWPAAQALAGVIAFENLPTSGSTLVSYHHETGPVLADDFIGARGGAVSRVEWWGGAATSNSWELVFQTNNALLNVPNRDDDFTGALAKYLGVIAVGVADDVRNPTLLHYTADIQNGLLIEAGKPYWLTVANYQPDWSWAQALGGASVGAEQFNAQRSVAAAGILCMDGGPHCGPWEAVHTDLAFRINVVPEPGTVALLAAGLLGVAIASCRRPFRLSNLGRIV